MVALYGQVRASNSSSPREDSALVAGDGKQERLQPRQRLFPKVAPHLMQRTDVEHGRWNILDVASSTSCPSSRPLSEHDSFQRRRASTKVHHELRPKEAASRICLRTHSLAFLPRERSGIAARHRFISCQYQNTSGRRDGHRTTLTTHPRGDDGVRVVLLTQLLDQELGLHLNRRQQEKGKASGGQTVRQTDGWLLERLLETALVRTNALRKGTR